jgi:hypothetical protein
MRNHIHFVQIPLVSRIFTRPLPDLLDQSYVTPNFDSGGFCYITPEESIRSAEEEPTALMLLPRIRIWPSGLGR